MSYRDLAIVNISLQATGITGEGFGTPLFASAHRYFPERVRAYTSLTAVGQDIPTSSNAYKAAESFFSNSPAPSLIKLGRREASLDLTVATGSTGASLVFSATDGTDTYSKTITITAQLDEDAVATGIAAAIEGDADIGPLVVATASTNTVSIDVAASSNDFWVQTLSSELSETYTTTETATDLLVALEQEDSDFYFFTAADHTETFVLAASDAIEARKKQYFVSVQEQTALGTYTEGSATDILGKLKDSGNTRTVAMFSHVADTEFPECTYVGYNAPFLAGSVTWSNLLLASPVAQDPSTGFALSATQKGNLIARDVSYVDPIGGQNVLRGGRTVSGTPIDFIRGRDSLENDLEVAYTNLLLNQRGGKLGYTNASINRLVNTLINVLSRYVVRNFIREGFEQFINFPLVEDVPVADIEAGIYQAGTFSAELVGAITEIGPINGTLALDLG